MSTGSSNIGIGANVMQSMQSGNNNIVIGVNALNTATTGDSTLAIGNNALYYKGPSGGSVIAIGDSAGYNFGIGGASASGATIIGVQAMYNGNGVGSVAIGYQALYGSQGNSCIAIGSSSGVSMTSGNYNVIIGSNNGSTLTGTNNNIILADGQGLIAAQWQNGGGWYQRNNNASWSVTSDQRIKKNIVDLTNGLDVILALRPREFDRIVEGTHAAGWIAQEYELVLADQVHETPCPSEEYLVLTDGEPVKGIHENLMPYAVSAIQTLKKLVDDLATENAALKARLDAAGF
jgi:Chaperone of endosialidase